MIRNLLVLFLGLLAVALPAQAGKVRVMGWADATLRESSTEGSYPYFDLAHVYFVVDAQIDDRWSLFSEVELEHLPRFDGDVALGKIMVERAYIQREAGRFRLRIGKFNTPFGVRIPLHWEVLTPMISRPIHADNEYVPKKSVGAEGRLALETRNLLLGLTGFVSNGVESSGTNVAVDGLTGVGGDVSLTVRSVYRVGVSAHRMTEPDEGGRAHVGLVGYVDLTLPANLLVRGEHTVHWRGRDKAFTTLYALCTYSLHPYDRLTFGYRIAHGVDGRRADGGLHTSHTMNIALEPAESVRIVLEEDLHRYPGSGTGSRGTTLWLGVTF